ncbi:MAG: DNA polymerase III subunit beta [Desulfobacterales bacterium]
MKCSIRKQDFIEMLANVQGITGKRSSLAITENLLITAANGQVTVCATDIEIGFQGIYPAEIEKEGKIAINARYLYDIAKKTRKENIFLNETKKQWIEITDLKDGSSLKYNIVGADPEEFPELPQIKEINYFDLSAARVKKMLSWGAMIQAGGDEKRTHLIGVNFEYQQEDEQYKIRMISTDGKRLTKTEIPYKDAEKAGMSLGTNVIIPKKALQEVMKFIKKEGNIKIGVKDNYCVINKENEIIYVNLLSGNFPDLNTVFTDDDKHIIHLNHSEFKEMLERMSILTTEDYKGVIFRLEDNNLYINAANPDRGESFEFMAVDFKNKDTIETMFNPHYFIEALNLIEQEKVLMKIKDDQSPCILCGEEAEEDINIIMPMKI